MTISNGDGYARAYSHWLRTGRWLRPYAADGRELKFNPYHDPRNGQFTFAPGGPRSLSRILVADRAGTRTWIEGALAKVARRVQREPDGSEDMRPGAEPLPADVQLAQ